MTKDTVTVDSQDYVFPLDEVVKPEKEDESGNLIYDGSNGGMQ